MDKKLLYIFTIDSNFFAIFLSLIDPPSDESYLVRQVYEKCGWRLRFVLC